jgi:hypothetical protein
MLNKRIALSLLVSFNYLTGCATIFSGKTQSITVDSSPSGARCELLRQGRVVGVVDPTPGSVMLEKTKHDIEVVCKKNGAEAGKYYADSGIDGAVYANILLGGVIGWGVDSAVGADNKYPEVINVSLANQSAINTQGTEDSDTMNKLQTLKKLRDEGVLTEKEYQEKRAKLIKNL